MPGGSRLSDLMLKCTCIPQRKTNKSRFCARLGGKEDINKLTENSFCDFSAQQGPGSRAGGERKKREERASKEGESKKR